MHYDNEKADYYCAHLMYLRAFCFSILLRDNITIYMLQDSVMSCVGIACRLGVPCCTTVVYCTLRIMCVHDIFKTSEEGLKIPTMTYRYLTYDAKLGSRPDDNIAIIFFYLGIYRGIVNAVLQIFDGKIYTNCVKRSKLDIICIMYGYNLKDL